MMNGPELWDAILDQAPKGSIIMGGAVVDWEFSNGTPKDIDVFYPYWNNDWVPPLDWTMQEYDYNKVIAQYDDADLNGKPHICRICNYKIPGTIPEIQMIGLDMPRVIEWFKSFDHTLTLAMYSKKGLFFDQRLFKSYHTQTVTCLNPVHKQKTLERAKKKVMKLDPNGANDWTYLNF